MKKTFVGNEFTAEFTDGGGYFSITGFVDGGCGAVGDKVAEFEKRFAFVNSMHLSDCKTGEPMHAEANGMYHAKRMNKNAIIRTLRCTEEQAIELIDLAFRINGSQKRIDEIQPYRTHQCSLPVEEFHKQEKVLTRDQLNEQAIKHKRCGCRWISMVEFSDTTTNLSGEKTQFCPKCGRKPQFSSEWVHKDKTTYNCDISTKTGEELQNLYNIHYNAKKKVKEMFTDLRNQWAVEARRVYFSIDEIPSDLRTPDPDFEWDDFDEPERVRALAELLGCDPSIITEDTYPCTFSAQGSDWLVVDDDEAEAMWGDDLEDYVEDCIIYEMEPHLREYFDKMAWVADAMAQGERANSLARYDGVEHFISTDDGDYYIYQQ